MYTVGNYTARIKKAIPKGKIYKDAGGIAFSDLEQAIHFSTNYDGKLVMDIFELEQADSNSYSDTPTGIYTTQKILMYPVKIKSIVLEAKC